MKTFNEDFAKRFKKSYSYKMGGSQTVLMPDGQSFHFNDKEYYSGRGSKYNSSIRHEDLGKVNVTKEEVESLILNEIQMINRRKINGILQKEKNERILNSKENGIYSIEQGEWCNWIELSDEEKLEKFFDSKRLAATLLISEEDAELLNSQGKTYVFAISNDGNVYEIFHSSLDCNPLDISIKIATPERIAKFKSKEWQSAPYANCVGQTKKSNHFVC